MTYRSRPVTSRSGWARGSPSVEHPRPERSHCVNVRSGPGWERTGQARVEQEAQGPRCPRPSPSACSSSSRWRSSSTTSTASTTPPTRSPPSVATRALRPQVALLMAAAFNFIGAFAGTAVAKTIGAGLVDEQTTTQAIVAAALLGAIAWNLLTWWLGLPSSSRATRSSAGCSARPSSPPGRARSTSRASSTRCSSRWSPRRSSASSARFVLMVAAVWMFRRTAAQADGPPFRRLQVCPRATWPSPTARTTPRRRWASSPSPCSRRAPSRPSRCRSGSSSCPRRRSRSAPPSAAGGSCTRWASGSSSSSRSTASPPRRPPRRVLLGTAHFGMPVSTTHVISSAIMGVGTSQGVRRRPLGRRPQHPRRLGHHHPRRRHRRRARVARHHGSIGARRLTGTRRPTCTSPPDAQGRAVLRAVHRRRREPPRGGARELRRDGHALRPARGARRRDPGAREAGRRDRATRSPQRLEGAFITPFDREDIHELVGPPRRRRRRHPGGRRDLPASTTSTQPTEEARELAQDPRRPGRASSWRRSASSTR